jgi:hypothetical protein
VGVNARQPVADALAVLPRQCWRSAIDADGQARDGSTVVVNSFESGQGSLRIATGASTAN